MLKDSIMIRHVSTPRLGDIPPTRSAAIRGDPMGAVRRGRAGAALDFEDEPLCGRHPGHEFQPLWPSRTAASSSTELTISRTIVGCPMKQNTDDRITRIACDRAGSSVQVTIRRLVVRTGRADDHCRARRPLGVIVTTRDGRLLRPPWPPPRSRCRVDATKSTSMPRAGEPLSRRRVGVAGVDVRVCSNTARGYTQFSNALRQKGDLRQDALNCLAPWSTSALPQARRHRSRPAC